MAKEAYRGRKFKTEFLSREPIDLPGVREIAEVSKAIWELGMGEENEGNVSVRKEPGMLIKAGGVSMGEMTCEDVVYVAEYDIQEKKARVKGLNEPSSETPMHWLIYQMHPGAKAIVHAHDPMALENPKALRDMGFAVTGPGLAYGTLEQAGEVSEKLKSSRYVLIAGHGSVSVGESLEEAYDLMRKVHERLKR